MENQDLELPKIEYRQVGDYLEPILDYPEQPEGDIGKYGWQRLRFMKEHRQMDYRMMRLAGTLKQYLMDFNEQANETLEQMMEQSLKAEPAPDKATHQLEWVRHMNSLKARCEEILRSEMINA